MAQAPVHRYYGRRGLVLELYDPATLTLLIDFKQDVTNVEMDSAVGPDKKMTLRNRICACAEMEYISLYT